jgi:hypothetical protein
MALRRSGRDILRWATLPSTDNSKHSWLISSSRTASIALAVLGEQQASVFIDGFSQAAYKEDAGFSSAEIAGPLAA